MVESQPSKLLVAGSIPVSRSNLRSARKASRASVGEPLILAKVVTLSRSSACVGGVARKRADVAQLAERVLGKDEVSSSILDIGSRLRSPLN